MLQRKWLSALLAVCIVLTLGACSSKVNNTNSSNSTAPSPVASDAPAKEEPKPALKALMTHQTEDYNTYPVAKVLEERTGYKVQYDMLPADKPEDKLNLIIASEEPYDLVSTWGGGVFQTAFAEYASKGALTDLTPLIEQYGPNIKAKISQASLDSGKVDGKIYMIPTKTIEFVGESLLIRKDWLDKLNLQVPTTLDELVNVLKQFKDKDPGGNGDKNIPMTILGDNPFIENIVGAFGLPNKWNDINGHLTPRLLDPGYKEYVAFVTDLFNQGLLDKEFAVNNGATMKEKLSSGRAGVIPLSWASVPGITDALVKNFPNAELVSTGALKGKDGKSGFRTALGADRMVFIPKSAKNPIDAIKWIDAKLENDTFKLMTIGEEGKHFTVKDGIYTPILPIFTDERNRANNYLTGIDEKNYPTYWQARIRKDIRLFNAFETVNMKQPDSVKFPDILGMAPYLPAYSKNNQQLNGMLNDETIKYIFGTEKLADLEAFQQKYKAAGGEESVKEVNEWYSSFKK